MGKCRTQRLWLLKLLAICAMLFVPPCQSHAADVTLVWDANTEPDLTGYRVYYKIDTSGERVLDSYNGVGLVLLEESGTTRVVSSGFETSGVSCHLSGLDDGRLYFFVLTALDTEGLESSPSREVSNDNVPPNKPIVLSGFFLQATREVVFEWSPSTDPLPGSGMAGYSCVLDLFSDTTPEATPNLSLVTAATVQPPSDGSYWFHIRAVDKTGPAGPNASETEHFGPIIVDTGPPLIVDSPSIDYVNNFFIVAYNESNMQHADQQCNYAFSDGLRTLGDGMDVSGVSEVFSFPLDPATVDRYLVYRLYVATNVTDAAGNPVSNGDWTIAINDDDKDQMADEWERMWFGDITSKDGSADTDGDGVPDGDEYLYATGNPQLGISRWTLSPVDTDSDNDDIPDGYEIYNGLNPIDDSDRDLDPDGNGSTNYQEYFERVVIPVINPISDSISFEWEPFSGLTASLSQGSVPITWSLLSAPPGMEIDRVTGEVYWSEPKANGSPHTITIRAANDASFDDETWLLTVVPFRDEYYVSTSRGDDGTGNGSLEFPWKSIGFALSETQESLSLLVTIHVSAGRYLENITTPRSGIDLQGGWNSDFSQRWAFVQNGVEPSSEFETIIDGQNLGPVVVASDMFIDGFTITGGNGTYGGGISGGDWNTVSNCKILANSAYMGGGICLVTGTGSVTNCLFSNNSAEFGGGLCTRYSDLVTANISGCRFRGNSAATGGAIFNVESSPTIENCLLEGNTGHTDGGGIANEFSYPKIVNCTLSGNTTGGCGGAIGNFADSTPTLTNNILWGNAAGVSGNEVHNDTTSGTITSFCNIGGSGGSGDTWAFSVGTDYGGNIDVDPLFVDPTSHNFHLRYLSPCVDAGDPASDYSREPEPNGGRINMGAYGGTREATTTHEKGDADGDEDVDLADAILSLQVVSRVEPITPVHRKADVNGDGRIGLQEAIFILQKISGLRP